MDFHQSLQLNNWTFRRVVWATLILALIVFCFCIVFGLIGSPYPSLLGVAGALACLIPVVGAALAVIPPLVVGLLTNVQISLFTAVYTLIVMIILAIWVRPRLYNRKWDNPILTIVLMITLADAFGIIGIILAPLLSIVGRILWSRLVSHRHTSGASEQISDLRERQEHIKANILKMDEPPVPLVTSIMERLSLLLEKADPVLQAAILADPPELIPNTSQSEQE